MANLEQYPHFIINEAPDLETQNALEYFVQTIYDEPVSMDDSRKEYYSSQLTEERRHISIQSNMQREGIPSDRFEAVMSGNNLWKFYESFGLYRFIEFDQDTEEAIDMDPEVNFIRNALRKNRTDDPRNRNINIKRNTEQWQQQIRGVRMGIAIGRLIASQETEFANNVEDYVADTVNSEVKAVEAA